MAGRVDCDEHMPP
jgi:hypothetical protein